MPGELTELSELKKPVINNELDMIRAYTDLFYSYKECVIKIESIKELYGSE